MLTLWLLQHKSNRRKAIRRSRLLPKAKGFNVKMFIAACEARNLRQQVQNLRQKILGLWLLYHIFNSFNIGFLYKKQKFIFGAGSQNAHKKALLKEIRRIYAKKPPPFGSGALFITQSVVVVRVSLYEINCVKAGNVDVD